MPLKDRQNHIRQIEQFNKEKKQSRGSIDL